jgi:hypothetical protein
MIEALSSSETLVLTRATRRNIPDDTILYVPFIALKAAVRLVLFSTENYVGETCHFVGRLHIV